MSTSVSPKTIRYVVLGALLSVTVYAFWRYSNGLTFMGNPQKAVITQVIERSLHHLVPQSLTGSMFPGEATDIMIVDIKSIGPYDPQLKVWQVEASIWGKYEVNLPGMHIPPTSFQGTGSWIVGKNIAGQWDTF